jgi:hypothetical protein
MVNPVKELYNSLTKFFDTSLLGIFIGIISGAAVNIATGQNISGLFLQSILCNIAAVIFLIILTKIRQNIDSHFWDRSKLAGTEKEHWSASADFSNRFRVILFFISFIGFVACSWAGILKITKANKTIAAETIKGQTELQAKNETYYKDSMVLLNKQVAVLNDSIAELKKHNNSITDGKPVKLRTGSGD